MSKNKVIAAIDIGSSKITTLIAQAGQESMLPETSINVIGVTASPSRGVKKGQIVDIEDAVEATIDSVEAAERMAGYNIDRAFISVGGAHIASQNSTGVVAVSDPQAEVTASDSQRVIEAARAISLPTSREVIHVIPRQFIVDGESGVRDPVGMSGIRLEVDTHVVTASTAALRNLTKTINEVGVDIEEIVFSGLAASYATLSETEKELGCVLIDIGSGATSIAAFVDGALSYSGSLPIGSRNVTNDLAIGLRVSLETAEKIKISLSRKPKMGEEKKDESIEISEEGSKEVKKISKRTLTEGIIRPRLNEIFTLVRLELEKAGIFNKIPSGAILTGGGSLTTGILDAAKRTLSLPTRVAIPSGVNGLTDDIMFPQFSVSIGLLLYASQSQKNYTQRPSLGGLARKVKAPNSAMFGRIIHTIKDLLP